MLCDECNKAVKISEDRFETKELHDKCKISINVNGQTERCGCICQLNTLPPLNVIAELDGEDADTFLEYNNRDLNSTEKKSLEESYNLYKNKKYRQ